MGAPQPAEESTRRRRLGAWYTPASLVDHVVDLAFADPALRPSDRPLRALDPACGDGRFLAALRQRAGAVDLTGCDIDPGALAASRAALGDEVELIEADALEHDWAGRQFDLVIGNPPFLNRLASLTARGHRSRWGGGPYADAAAEFLGLAASVVRPDGGRIALIVPLSLLTTRDAAPIRDALVRRTALTHLWWSPTPVFDAQVRTAALVLTAGAVQGPVRRTHGPGFEARGTAALQTSWGALLLDDDQQQPPTSPSPGPVLGDLATFSADFRDQYYGLVGAVGDDVEGPPLVTCGLIDPGTCHWGQRPVRFAGQRYGAPRVDLARLRPELQHWAASRLVPKVLVANQTRTIEAVVDRTGAWLPSVPVISAVPRHPSDPDVLDRVAAVLASPAATAWARHHAAGSGLSADTIRLSPRLLASIPLPDDH
jgi:SAM-dependent methyltransferase